MNNKLKKKIIGLLLMCLAIATTVAFAEIQSTGNFSYGTFTANGTLSVDWSAFSNDVCSAKTNRVSPRDTRYVVNAYVEAQDFHGQVLQTSKDAGYEWAQADIIRKGVWRFNSTHGIAFSNNSYASKTYRTLTDW